jgi:beta-alanine degradation protein BauB
MMPRVEDPDLGPIASQVVYEDEHVRIWTHQLEPGEAGPLHRHDLDYVIVDVAGERIAADPLPGSGADYGGYVEAPVKPGKSYSLRAGATERAINVGTTPYRTVIVELKHRPSDRGAPPDPA